MFQINLHWQVTATCAEWIDVNNILKSQEIATELAVFIERRCNCSFPPSHITTPQFTCPQDYPQHVTYRASVNVWSLPAQLNRSMLMGVLETWPLIHRSIFIQGERVSVEHNCPVIIQSFEDQQCVPTTAPPTVSLTTFLATVLSLLLIALLAVVAMVIICTIKHRNSSQK